MRHSYKYAIIKFNSHPIRGEVLNVGIAIITDEIIDVRPTRRINKLHSISTAIDLDMIRSSLMRLPLIDEIARDEGAISFESRLDRIAEISGIHFSSTASFHAADTAHYETIVAQILKDVVDPEPAPVMAAKKKLTALKSSLIKTLKERHILAAKDEDFSSHRIVVNHRLAEGIEADLMLQNGSMHVIEAVDVTSDNVSLRKVISDIAVSTIVFEQAKMIYGEEATSTKLIYRASVSQEASAAPALSAAAHQGAQLINWESSNDRIKFLNRLTDLAVPLRTDATRHTHLDASVLQRSLIN